MLQEIEDQAFELWTLRDELAEEIILGGQLAGNKRFLDLQRKLHYTHHDPWRRRVAIALVDYADAGGDFEDEYKLAMFLDAKGLGLGVLNLRAMTESLRHYLDWIQGECHGIAGLPQPPEEGKTS